MKPSVAISVVVLAVLATVAIEEFRISNVRAELIRLREFRRTTTAAPAKPAAIPSVTTPIESPTPATPAPEDTPKPAPLPGQRQIPDEFPEPSDEQIKETALSPDAELHLQLGLNPRQAAYLEELLVRRKNTQSDLAMAWVSASTEDRPAGAQAMQTALDKSDADVRLFLNRDADFEAFAAFHTMQPEREMLTQLNLLLDQAGIALELAKEQQLVAAMYQARIGSNALDWNSPAALPVIAGGGGIEQFEKEWDAQSAALKTSLAGFLTAEEAAAVLSSREQLRESTRSSIQSVSDALSATPE